jgi:hypothetical protein
MAPAPALLTPHAPATNQAAKADRANVFLGWNGIVSKKRGAFAPPSTSAPSTLIFAPAPQLFELAALPLQLQLVLLYLLTLDR